MKTKGKADPNAALFERWKNGATIHELVTETKMTRSQMRRLLTQGAGGKAQFRELRAAGAGGKAVPFGGKRASGGPREPKPLPSDKGLPLFKSMTKEKGWSWRYVPEHEPRPLDVKIKKGDKLVDRFTVMDTGDRILIMISPKGNEYVKALDHEPADILRVNPTFGPKGPPIRFVKWKKSETRKRVEQHMKRGEKQAERGEAALERVKERKSAARAARKARKAEKKRTRTRGGN